LNSNWPPQIFRRPLFWLDHFLGDALGLQDGDTSARLYPHAERTKRAAMDVRVGGLSGGRRSRCHRNHCATPPWREHVPLRE
jgi:hypothetical protein